MATYADGTTIAEVGDIVKCVAPNGSMFKPLNCERSYKVVGLSGDSVYLEYPSEHGFLCSRFELIKRTGADAPSPAKAEPLVKWPEENKQLAFRDLKIDELFAFADEWQHQIVRRCVGGGKYINVFVGGGAQDCSCYDASGGRAVRRIQFNPANKEAIFIVI